MRVSDHPALASIDAEQLRDVIFPVEPTDIRLTPAPAWLPRLWGADTAALTLPGMILVERGRLETGQLSSVLLVHELIHARQWIDLGWAGFLTAYLGAYLRGRAGGLSHGEAYRAIPLEIEARRVAALFGGHPGTT